MNRLFIANFVRIKNSKLYWGLCCSMFIVALAMTINALANSDRSIDNAITVFVIPIGLALAVFLSLFLGTEYSDGTIRNKLIAHDRRQIYIANLFASFVCTIGLVVSYMIPVVLIGFPCVGLPNLLTVGIMSAGFVTLLAFCSLFTMVGMIYANKAGATVVNLVLSIVLVAIGAIICSVLTAPEFIPSYDIGTGIVYLPNPRYATGVTRVILQILANISPAGQAVQFAMGVTDALWSLPLYSFGICGLCSVAGAVVFNKKDIK